MYKWQKILCCCVVAVTVTGCGSSSQVKKVSEHPTVTETPSVTLLQQRGIYINIVEFQRIVC